MNTVLENEIASVKIRCHTSDDRIKLFLDLIPLTDEKSENQEFTSPEELFKQIINVLEKIISKERLNEAVVKHAVDQFCNGEEVLSRRIAKGREAKPPRDGRLVFLVKKISRTPDFIEDKSGSVDMRSLRLFENVHVKQDVVRVYPPQRGEAGEDVFGRSIESEMGKEIEYSVDETLKVTPPQGSNSYSVISSNAEGYLLHEGKSLSINNELVIHGDVDYSVGNIDFIGSVSISGSVKSGFAVKAKKDIHVKGLLEGGHLVSTEGSVTVDQLVAGSGISKIGAATDVTLSIAQGAVIHAGQNLKISKEARNCTLHSHSQIDMTDADLIGGRVYAICGITAKSVGNEHGVNTNISFCSDIEMSPEYRTLVADIAKHQSAINVLKSHLGPYAETPDRVILLNEGVKERIVELLHRYGKVVNSHAKLVRQRDKMLISAKDSSTAAVSFTKALYPGVEIEAFNEIFSKDTIIEGPAAIVWNDEEEKFSVSDYQAIVCDFRTNSVKESGEAKDEG